MYDDSVHSGLTTVSQFVPSIFLSVASRETREIERDMKYREVEEGYRGIGKEMRNREEREGYTRDREEREGLRETRGGR